MPVNGYYADVCNCAGIQEMSLLLFAHGNVLV